MALSKEACWIAVDFLFGFWMRLLLAVDCARSDGQAHSDDLGIV
jgi:hypothetical protein